MDKKIKVIKVINDYTVVINAGYNDDIQENYEFLIYEKGEELFDPDTNESLGFLENVKGTASPIHIQNKMTTLKSNKYSVLEQKKIIKKSGRYGLAALSGGVTEEIIEPGERTLEKFDFVNVGDFVKIIGKKQT
ncbi:hypothetical protein [Halarcobacter anaerophilus]|uniref:hypothetical protein n=1 Tax=Halarcobacter anaerophilus TaxID=877500 RepID=UPI001163D7EF|nr:hypothetical protein [Halarcobacter anaerophilus]QDF28290.1 hypothetical protein AANAER_0797 [Halarcobacter anaerophilus]